MTTNVKLQNWVEEIAKMTQPDAIRWIEGTEAEKQELLDAMPAIDETEYVRHVRFNQPLKIMMDGKKQLGVVLLPTDGDGQ